MIRLGHFFLIILSIVLLSCKPQVPSQYIQPGEFEDILYDYHLADAMSEESDNGENSQYNKVLFRQAVLKKYGITQADFDSTLVYYTRHADRLHTIYENLSKRFADESMALGSSSGDVNRFGNITSKGDTANIWNGDEALLLTAEAPYNVVTYNIPTDTTFHAGDKIMLRLNCDFIFKDGMKDAVAMLAVQFKNDSIASQVIHMSTNSNYSLTITDGDKLGIKTVRGFFFLPKRNNDSQAKLCLLAISNIQMIRFHVLDKPASTSTDSVKTQRTDTLSPNKLSDTPETLPAPVDKEQIPPPVPDRNGSEPESNKPIKLQPVRHITR